MSDPRDASSPSRALLMRGDGSGALLGGVEIDEVIASFERLLEAMSDAVLGRVLGQAPGPAREVIDRIDRGVARRVKLGTLSPADIAQVRRGLTRAQTTPRDGSRLVTLLVCWAEGRMVELAAPPSRESLRAVRVGARMLACAREPRLLDAVKAGLDAWDGDLEEGALLRAILTCVAAQPADDISRRNALDELRRIRGQTPSPLTAPEDAGTCRSEESSTEQHRLGGSQDQDPTAPAAADARGAWESEAPASTDRSAAEDGDPSLAALQGYFDEVLSLRERMKGAIDAGRFQDVVQWGGEAASVQRRLEGEVDSWCDARGLDAAPFLSAARDASRSRDDAAALLADLREASRIERERRARRVDVRREEIRAACADAELPVPPEVEVASTIDALEQAFVSLGPALARGRCRVACLSGRDEGRVLLDQLVVADRVALHEEIFLERPGAWPAQIAALLEDRDLWTREAHRAVDLSLDVATVELEQGRGLPDALWNRLATALGAELPVRISRASTLLGAMSRAPPTRWSIAGLARVVDVVTSLPVFLRDGLRRHELGTLTPPARVARLAEVALDDGDVDARAEEIVDALLDAGRERDALALAATLTAESPRGAPQRIEGLILVRFLGRAIEDPENAWVQELLHDAEVWLTSTDGTVVLLYLVERLALDDLRAMLRHVYGDALARARTAWPALADGWLIPRALGEPTAQQIEELLGDARRAWDEWGAELKRGHVHEGWLPNSRYYQVQINEVLRGWLGLVEAGKPMPPCVPEAILQDAERTKELPTVRAPAKDNMVAYITKQRERLEAFARVWPHYREPLGEIARRRPSAFRDALEEESARAAKASPAVAAVYERVLQEVEL